MWRVLARRLMTSARSAPRVMLLDGGTGEELFARGLPDDRKIWSATALVHEQHHELLKEVHTAFLTAGSDYVTCNNYGVTPGVGFSDNDIVRLAAVAGRLAREACEQWKTASRQKKQVCGSLPPLLESYRADKVPKFDEGVRLYAMIARALGPYVDCYLAETLSSVKEAKMALLGAQKAWEEAENHARPRQVMVSFTLNSQGRLRSGESVRDAAEELMSFIESGEATAELRAMLFNCSQPEAVSMALAELKGDDTIKEKLRSHQVQLGAYANRLTAIPDDWALAESSEPQAMRTDLAVEIYTEFVSQWVTLGAEIVGGCCGIGPEYIASIDKRLKDEGRR